MPSVETLRTLVRDEIIQRGEEGADTAGFKERWQEARSAEELWNLYRDLLALPIREDFPYREPSDLQGIRQSRDEGVRRFKMVICEEDLLDRLHGAWLGRVAGCVLGKPVEGWSHERIRQYLEGADAYPMTDYLPAETRTPPEGVPQPYTWCTKGYIHAGERDDDTDYTVLGLHIFERHGAEFTTRDVGNAWLHLLPAYQTYTAERQAYINLVNELPLDEVPIHLNPYREWIGARIRADFWGYVAPGCPEKAAEFAYRDAALSHVKNGIYGEMFVAAMIAAAFATQDVVEIIRAGASEIPAQSREAEMIRDCLQWRKECRSWQEALERLLNRYYGKYHPVHTVNNDGIVLNALLWGWPDFEKVITISVMQGMDTDCNGATAGSIWGAAFGAKALPAKWIEPLQNTLYSAVFGFAENRISDLAKRSLKQATKVLTGTG